MQQNTHPPRFSPWFPFLAFLWLSACSGGASPTPPSPEGPLPQVLILYDWEADMPASVLEAFTAEYGIEIDYQTYTSQEEAIANLQAGKVYDLVVLENQNIPTLAAATLLAEIDYQNLPNFKNISPNFRDLAYDSGNRHSVPFNWGTTGLLVNRDLVLRPMSRWADLWDDTLPSKIAIWETPRDVIGIALKSLGYSVNTENPAELELALSRLIQLGPRILFVRGEGSAGELLASGQASIAIGYAGDVQAAQESGAPVEYILPGEGTLLWGDNFTIPAASPNRRAAELFLDFILRPEVSAEIVNANNYATPNEAAQGAIAAEILNDPIIFPPNELLRGAEIILPLSWQGERLYAQVWERFLAATQIEVAP
ncbi:MAG TPA: spermidine/putrescine ABC transporter substrate-binding protein [Anaerolineales bacterium]|nr:spermidine/putrescine ABC transporter substrate-binding protein [Anaerolineales bacterium]